jgi:hypothetical protein
MKNLGTIQTNILSLCGHFHSSSSSLRSTNFVPFCTVANHIAGALHPTGKLLFHEIPSKMGNTQANLHLTITSKNANYKLGNWQGVTCENKSAF